MNLYKLRLKEHSNVVQLNDIYLYFFIYFLFILINIILNTIK